MPTISPARALFVAFPRLMGRVPFVELGQFPTRVHEVKLRGGSIWIKRDDESGVRLHGGCKVRKLEFLLGDALAHGANTISVLSASCSNFLLSAATHAGRFGLKTVAMLYRQYRSTAALRMHARIDELGVPHSSAFAKLFFPLLFSLHNMGKVVGVPRREWAAPGSRLYVMPPGGSSPLGCLGFLSAALELVDQVAHGEFPPPDMVVVPVGSCGIIAGLLAGFHLAGFATSVIGVRVVDRAVANPLRISTMANATLAYLRSLVEKAASVRESRETSKEQLCRSPAGVEQRLAVSNPIRPAHVRLLGNYFGGEYALPTRKGERAMRLLGEETGIQLEPTYSAKTFAAVLDLIKQGLAGGKNVLFWCTATQVDSARPERTAEP